MEKKVGYRENFSQKLPLLQSIPATKAVLDSVLEIRLAKYLSLMDDCVNFQEAKARHISVHLLMKAYPEETDAARALGLHRLPTKE